MGERTEVVTDSWQHPDIATTGAGKRPGRRKQRQPQQQQQQQQQQPRQRQREKLQQEKPKAQSVHAVVQTEDNDGSLRHIGKTGRLTHSCESVSKPARRKQQPSIMAMVYEQGVPLNPDPRALTWQRLEAMRLKKLGISPSKYAYSRHFMNVFRNPQLEADTVSRMELAGSGTELIHEAQSIATGAGSSKHSVDPLSSTSLNNSVAPFATVGKPTCGYFFTDQTNNKKVKFGIPPSDLVKWRNYVPRQA